MIEPIKLKSRHKRYILEMSIKLFPEHGEVQFLKSYCATKYDATGSPYLRWYVPFIHEGKECTKLIEVHWFEFLMTYLVDAVAENFAKNPYTEKSWSKYLILQKICNELGKTNPIDFLYDLWKNPGNYSEL